jgi:TolB-like protein/Tfp pilus assembly protein PilF
MKNVQGGLQKIRFGTFELDAGAGELHKHGIKIRIQDLPLQILHMLLEKPGRVVSRDELRSALWPTNSYIDFDQSLNRAINKLRDALGDSAETPQLIETLPRRGYRFIGTLATGANRIESLAVLPLENLSRDPEQEYFADGLTEALINALAKIGELRVVSRTSAMQYKGVHKPLPAIAQELGVDAIVEGTVLRSENRVRITAQLIDASRETHLWAENYERDLREVLTLQSEVAQAIAHNIRVKLAPVDQARFREVQPVDPEAYEAYLKGRYHWNRRNADGLGKATQFFQQAITCDPAYPAAYSGLADCLCALGWQSFLSPADASCKAKRLAQKAVALDRALAEGYASLAWATMLYDYDFTSAEKAFERSIELNPRYAPAHQWFGLLLALMGRYEEGYTEIKRATRLDPHPIMNQTLAFICFTTRRYDQAIEQYEKVLELDPRFAYGYRMLGLTYLFKGMHEAAIAAGEKAAELSQGSVADVACLAETYAEAGYRDKAQRTLQQLSELSKQRYVSPYLLAHICSALGKKGDTLDWLECAYRQQAAFMVMLKVDPRFDDLRSDARFQDLMRRMNFPS